MTGNPEEKDPGKVRDRRVHMANERTFLAWIRTSLGLIAAGVAVAQFVPGPSELRHTIAFVLVSFGGVLAGISYTHWERNERAMRLGERLPYSMVPRLTAAALALVALAALILMIIDLAT